MAKLQANAAKRENEGIAPLEVEIYDDHLVHIAEHARYMAGEQFERICKESPELAKSMREHYLKHMEAAYEKKA